MATNEIEVLENKIKELERKRINLLYQLGKEYFEAKKEAPDDAFKDSISAVLDVDAGILANKDRIDALNNLVKCKKCGATIEGNALFCPECGTKLAEDSPKKACPRCGKENDADAAFCSGCGHKFERTVCPGCGAVLEGRPDFCMSCGYKLKAEEAPEQVAEEAPEQVAEEAPATEETPAEPAEEKPAKTTKKTKQEASE